MRLLWEVHSGATGGLPRPDSPAASEAPDGQPAQLLTDREYEVARAVCQGLANKSIARELRISEKTVKNHLSSIYRRTGVSGRTQLAIWAMRHGLVVAHDDPQGHGPGAARDRR